MKISATVQARMTSTRLPGKVLRVMAGKPMLQHQIERIQRSRLIDEIIIATTVNPTDDPIVELGQKLGVRSFRGSENDVLGRVANLLRENRVELHVELIGDSPFTDPQIVDEIIGYYLKHDGEYDYVTNGMKVTYPSGCEVNVYRAEALLRAEAAVAKDDPLREHVDIHLSKNKSFRSKNLEAPPYFHNPEIYLEVDTLEDFEMLNSIACHFRDTNQAHFSLIEILAFLKTRPDLVRANQQVHRRWKVFKET